MTSDASRRAVLRGVHGMVTTTMVTTVVMVVKMVVTTVVMVVGFGARVRSGGMWGTVGTRQQRARVDKLLDVSSWGRYVAARRCVIIVRYVSALARNVRTASLTLLVAANLLDRMNRMMTIAIVVKATIRTY